MQETKTIGYDRLKQILVDYVMNDFAGASETAYVRDILTDVCGCTIEEIKELGLDFLFPEEW